MAEVWVAAIGAVASVGSAAYGAYSQNKAQSAAASSQAAALKQGFQPLVLPDAKKPKPYDIDKLGVLGVNYDRHAYALSDADFNTRHAPIVQAENLFQDQVLKDQQGNTQLMPAMQNEFMRSGLQGALASFGNTPGTLAQGSAAEADVARNLGQSIEGFQQQTRQNALQSITTAEQLFPRRKFGLNGQDAMSMQMSNVNNQNAFQAQQHAEQLQLAQYNATGQVNFNNSQQAQSNINAQAAATGSASNQQAIISAGQMLAKLGAAYSGSNSASTVPAANATTPAPNYSGWKPAPATMGNSYYVPS